MTTFWPMVTWPSAARTTRPPRRTARIVVPWKVSVTSTTPRPGMGVKIGPAQVLPGHVGVDLGGGDAGVTQEFLDGAQVGAALEHVGGEGVPQGMRRDPPVGPGAAGVPGQDVGHAPASQAPAAGVEEQ